MEQPRQIQATFSAFAAVVAEGRVVTWGFSAHGGNSRDIRLHTSKAILSILVPQSHGIFCNLPKAVAGIAFEHDTSAVGSLKPLGTATTTHVVVVCRAMFSKTIIRGDCGKGLTFSRMLKRRKQSISAVIASCCQNPWKGSPLCQLLFLA